MAVFPYPPYPRAETTPAAAEADRDRRDFSERLLRSFLGMCENPRTRRRMLRLIKASAGNSAAGRRFYALLNRAIVHPAAQVTGVHTSALRVELVCAQLVGLAMMRYVLLVEPVASAPLDDVVRQYAPAIRATIGGD